MHRTVKGGSGISCVVCVALRLYSTSLLFVNYRACQQGCQYTIVFCRGHSHSCKTRISRGYASMHIWLYISLELGYTGVGREMAYSCALLLCLFLAHASGFAPVKSLAISRHAGCKICRVHLHASSTPRSDNNKDTRLVRVQQEVRESNNRIMKLERQVKSLESVVREVCSALLYCDDIVLMERQSRCVGEIYMDSDFSKIRTPHLLRQEISKAMQNHNIARKPLMYAWRSKKSHNTSVRIEGLDGPLA